MICSLQNSKVKQVIRLRDRRDRERHQLFLVEGLREIVRARDAGVKFVSVFVCGELLTEEGRRFLEGVAPSTMWNVSPEVFAKMAVRSQSDGIIVTAHMSPSRSLEELSAKLASQKSFSILALENVEKPGNLGAVLRTADGSGCSAVFLLGSSVDVYNPQVIRASIGSCFVVPVIHVSHDETKAFSEKHAADIISLSPDGCGSLWELDLAKKQVLLFGAEATGLSKQARLLCHQMVAIPMKGVADSLNLSVSVGILAYEALRQRSLSSPSSH